MQAWEQYLMKLFEMSELLITSANSWSDAVWKVEQTLRIRRAMNYAGGHLGGKKKSSGGAPERKESMPRIVNPEWIKDDKHDFV